MPNTPEQALSFAQVLSGEYDSLRPESGYVPAANGESFSERELFSKIHCEERPLSALCISGGGIRSATFALGAIQGMAEQGVLGEFDYLSTVSGGGFIGGWLTSWKHRQGGLDRVIPYLRRNAPPIPQGDPDPIRHLREYNSYLSPKAGFFSTDTWTLGVTVVRNMMLNWLVFVPLLIGVLLAPRLVVSIARMGETYPQALNSFLFGSPLKLANLVPAVCCLLFAVTIFNTMRYLPGVGRKQHSELEFLQWVLTPAVLAAFVFIANDAWFTGGDFTRPGAAVPPSSGYLATMATGVISALAGWFAYLLFYAKSFQGRAGVLPTASAAVLLMGWSAGSAAWYLTEFVYPHLKWPVYVTVAAPLLIVAMMLAMWIFIGFSSRILKDEDREWLARAGAWNSLIVAAWIGVCALVLLGAAWLPAWGRSVLVAVGGAGGWISALAGASRKTAAAKTPADAAHPPSLAVRLAAALAAPAFAVAFIVGLAIATDWLFMILGLGASSDLQTQNGETIAHCPQCTWWNHMSMLVGTRSEPILLLGAASLFLGWLVARYININKFSLHAMYRNRLIRAYLGASNNRRQASKFTGFAEDDNLPMHVLNPRLKPFHVVNVTLNLVAGQRLAWQERKAASFTISPLHCGSGDGNLGYRPSAGYGGPPDGISLGTAIAISGAAASPNMGYNSSPVIAFIMTLFNARLGAWLGNPGKAGDKTWREEGPTSAVGSLVKEAFGLTNDTNQWVNLSDGGHFENLGLYEMVRRRCLHIVVLDGGCDPDFTYGDLGNALRKIRIDMKIPIDFADGYFEPLHRKEKRFAVARIGYSVVEDNAADGYLVYIKPMMRGNEPPDVLSYRSDNTAFPHQSTADQFFNESQTESYRMLGLHTLTEICQGWDGTEGIPGLIAYLSETNRVGAQAVAAKAGGFN
jgi:hypothetical protein